MTKVTLCYVQNALGYTRKAIGDSPVSAAIISQPCFRELETPAGVTGLSRRIEAEPVPQAASPYASAYTPHAAQQDVSSLRLQDPLAQQFSQVTPRTSSVKHDPSTDRPVFGVRPPAAAVAEPPPEAAAPKLGFNFASALQRANERLPTAEQHVPIPQNSTQQNTRQQMTPRRTADKKQMTPRMSKKERMAQERAITANAAPAAPAAVLEPQQMTDPIEALRAMQQGQQSHQQQQGGAQGGAAGASKRKLTKKERMAAEAAMMDTGAPKIEVAAVPEVLPAQPSQQQSNPHAAAMDPIAAFRAMQQGSMDQYGNPVAPANEQAAPAMDPIAALRAMQQGSMDQYGNPVAPNSLAVSHEQMPQTEHHGRPADKESTLFRFMRRSSIPK